MVLSLQRGDLWKYSTIGLEYLKTIVYIWWKVDNFYFVNPSDFNIFESFLHFETQVL